MYNVVLFLDTYSVVLFLDTYNVVLFLHTYNVVLFLDMYNEITLQFDGDFPKSTIRRHRQKKVDKSGKRIVFEIDLLAVDRH